MSLDAPPVPDAPAAAPVDTAVTLAERASAHPIEAQPSAVPDAGSTLAPPVPGITPETVAVPTQPAGPIVTEDDLRAHALRVAGGEDNLYRWIADSNARLAEAAARTKDLEARLAGAPPAAAQPPAVPGQPTPVAQPAAGTPPPAAVAEPPFVEPGPVAPPSPEQVEQAARDLVKRDPQMVAWHAEFHETAQLVGNPDRGIPGELGVVMGREGWRVPALDQRIQTFDEMLDPEKAGLLGITLDPLQREEIETARARLVGQANATVQKFLGLVARRDFLTRSYQGRFEHARSVVMEDVQAAQQVREREEGITVLATEMSKSWPIAFQSAVRAANVHESLLPSLWERIKIRGRVASVEETEDLTNWMSTAIRAEKADMDAYHRLMSGEYGRRLAVEAAIATGAAPTSVPLAPSSPNVMSPDEAFRRTSEALEARSRLRRTA